MQKLTNVCRECAGPYLTAEVRVYCGVGQKDGKRIINAFWNVQVEGRSNKIILQCCCQYGQKRSHHHRLTYRNSLRLWRSP